MALIALSAMAMLSPRAVEPEAGAPEALDALDGGRAEDAGLSPSLSGPEPDPAPEEIARLRSALGDWRAPDAVRCQAALELAERLGPAAVADLEPLLHNDREAIRLGATRALGQAGGEDAKKALEDRLELEETAEVREAIQRTLTLMQP